MLSLWGCALPACHHYLIGLWVAARRGLGPHPSFCRCLLVVLQISEAGAERAHVTELLGSIAATCLIFILCFVYCFQVGMLCNWGSPALGGSVLFVS